MINDSSDNKDASYLIINNGLVVDIGYNFTFMTGYSRAEVYKEDISAIINKLLKINCTVQDIENAKSDTTLFLFTKTNKAIEVTISISQLEDINQKLYIFTKEPNSRFDDNLIFAEQFFNDNVTGCALFSVPDSILLKVNQQYLSFIDSPYNRMENSLGKSIKEIVTGFVGTQAEVIWNTVLETQKSCHVKEYRHDNFSRGVTYWDVTLTPISITENMKYIFKIITDVTEKVQDRQLREEQAKVIQYQKEQLEQKNIQIKANHATLLNLAHDYIVIKDMNCAITFWNASAEKGYRWNQEEVFGKISHVLLKTQFPTSYTDFHNGLLSKAHWEGELIHTRKDGSEIIVESRQSLIRDIYGEPVAILEINRDITDRKRMEESIRYNEKRFRTCFDNMLDCIDIYIAIRDESGRITDFLIDYSNQASCLARKMTKEELCGRSYLELFHNYVKTELFYEYCKIVETGEPLIRFANSYHNELHKHISGVYDYKVFKFEDGIVISWRDITAQKKLEREMIRLDKLNLVGEMAAGIGHEVRNPMTTVRGFLQLLSTKEECSQYINYYALMIEELDRANSIISEFLCVAKDKAVEFKTESLKQIVENILPLIQSDATISDKYIHVELDEVQEIPLDKKEIHQLVINLVRNGLEAMPPGGNLKIRTFVETEAIVLSVQNNGPEIPQEVLEKIGTPFFTTKDNGTGLGLAVCFSIAARHKAKIDIQTGPTGTTFFVRFKS